MRNECNESNGDCISKEVVGKIALTIFKFWNLLITHRIWSGITLMGLTQEVTKKLALMLEE